MDEYCVFLSNIDGFRDTAWTMTIDLKRLSEQAGKRAKDLYNGGSFVDFPIPRAKKLLKLIREYGTQEDFKKVERFVENKKLAAYWKELTA